MTRVAGQDTSRTYVIVSSWFPESPVVPHGAPAPLIGDLVCYTATSCPAGQLHSPRWALRRACRSEVCRLPPRFSQPEHSFFSTAYTRAGSRPLRPPGTPLRRPKTTFPDAGLPLKSRLVWIKSYGEEPPLPSFCMPGKAFYHQFRKGNMWFLPHSVLLLAFNAPRAACGNAQKIIWFVPDTCTCSKCVWLGVNIYKPLVQGAVRATRRFSRARGKWLFIYGATLKCIFADSSEWVTQLWVKTQTVISRRKASGILSHSSIWYCLIRCILAWNRLAVDEDWTQSPLKEWLREGRLRVPSSFMLCPDVCLPPFFLMTNFMWSCRLPDSSQLHTSHIALCSGGDLEAEEADFMLPFSVIAPWGNQRLSSLRHICGFGFILIYLATTHGLLLWMPGTFFNNRWLSGFTGSQHRFLSAWGCKGSSDKKRMKPNVMKQKNP